MGKRTNTKEQPRATPEMVAPADVSFVEMYREEQEAAFRHEQIEALAYEIWVGRGRPEGTEEADWLEAERRLTRRDSSPPESR